MEQEMKQESKQESKQETIMQKQDEHHEAAVKCLKFIEQCPSCYHVVEMIEQMLKQEGYTGLSEQESWNLKAGGRYYVTRNGSSILSFRLPEQLEECRGFHIMASHSDFPSFAVKDDPEMTVEERYIKLNTEPYGGMIRSSWLDRSLSVAGRIIVEQDGRLQERCVKVDQDLLVIPSLAIHMDRETNKGVEYNLQTDLQPLLAGTGEKGEFENMLAQAAGVERDSILGKDLFLYVREEGRLFGARGEFMLSPRLDDLQCVFATLEGMLAARPDKYAAVHAVFDNEEVGSTTKQGAASTFLRDTLERIAQQLGNGRETYHRLLAGSFLLSADNAHAVHPNYTSKSDPTNRPYLNGGIVIKRHSGQKYTTDGWSEAVVKGLCQKAGVPWQIYYNRSDVPGGSTLGSISSTQVSIPAADIGLPQLAMHAAVETAGSMDTAYLIRLAQVFYSNSETR